MATVERTEIFNAPIEKIYDAIIDYASYPEFVDGVNEIEVHEEDENGAKVTYSLNIIKKFSYTLDLVHQRPNKVSWTFDSGDLFRSNNGSWTMKKIDDNKTEVTYALDVSFKLLVPKAITDPLAKTNLVTMMKSFKERVEN